MTISEVVSQSRASIEKEDLRVLLQILSFYSPQKIIEIGAWKGYSAWNWIQMFHPKDFITIEKDKEEILDQTIRMEGIGTQYWYGADSHDPRVLSDMRIYIPEADFLFIDGDHSYEGVKKDWEMYSPLVRKGGVVVFHDVVYTATNPDVQVKPLWDELKKQYSYVEIKSFPSSTGMGVLFK